MTDAVIPRRANGAAIAALVLGAAAAVLALLIGIRFSGLDAIFFGVIPLLIGGASWVTGIVGFVVGMRRGGIGLALAGVILGGLAVPALFLGRFLGEEYLGFPYPG